MGVFLQLQGAEAGRGGQVPTRAHLALKNGSRLGAMFLFHLLGDLAGMALVKTHPWWWCHLLPEAELGRPAPLTLFSTNASCLSLPQVPPASAKQHGVSLSTPSTPFQQASGYGQHSYGTGEGAPSPERHGQDWLTELTHASCPRHARL